MTEVVYLDEKYSTTRHLIKEKPIIANGVEDKFKTVLFLPEGENRKDEGGLRTKGYFKSGYEGKPLVSVITVVFNGERYIEETIKSVLEQNYNNIEYIIIDGASTDETVDIIKKYEDRIDYWISEEDSGVYDAMNKGLRLVTGDYIGLLNADDYYKEDAVELSIHRILDTNSDYSFANVEYEKSKIRAINPLEKSRIYQEMPYPHVSTFIASRVYKEVGLFDISLRIAGDHDMAVRIHLEGFKYCYVDRVVARLEEGGISSGLDSNKESLHVAIKNGKSTIWALFTYISQIVKVTTVKVLPKRLVVFIQQIKGSRFS